ncbi:LysR family transcriptional regulator [Curvibacter sp. RS43]|uniref:LysR family transcriptional regulator n=1 Tax=Curvibacter microcysteis TaxID=3026419 RepID=UPI00235EB363|nr:LysR family transcriptional regulator [Curvibacter sp. RS43]MDD0812939.1 LysR family transcriptional regulator [Curvibacter sp. RS43]
MDSFSDLMFFSLLMKHGSLASAAQELGVTPPAVSKRLAALERRLGVRLLRRTTRRMNLTPEGDLYLLGGAAVLRDMETLERQVSGSQEKPQGLLKVGATLGFGRRFIAPALDTFANQYPECEIQLNLSDRQFNLVEQGFDAVIRFGDLPDTRLTARLLANNTRILCASPKYLSEAGTPASPAELARHQCLFIREGDEAYGTWHLRQGARQETIKVRGRLSSNDGGSVMGWALNGHGIMMRSMWDVAPMLADGRLIEVLPEWVLPAADVYVVFPTRDNLSAKVRALVDHLVRVFSEHRRSGLNHWIQTNTAESEF